MRCLDNDALLGFVDGALAADQVRLVEEHLDQCAVCRRLLSELADAFVSSVGGDISTERTLPPDGELEDAELLAPGTLVDQYRVVCPIGRGGMGVVYLAEDPQLQRRVALKLIRPALLDSRRAVDRFLFEARATARFSHPNIVGIYGVGEHQGRPYVALEFIKGQALRSVMGTGSLPVDRAVRIALGIAEALLEAHRHQILHRDLKPANVIIGADGRPRVLDFGIAKAAPGAAQDGPAEGSGLGPLLVAPAQATVGFVGTPGYAAPEQLRSEAASSASDIWALGMILHELFLGFHPYLGSLDGRTPPSTPGEPIACRPAAGSALDLVRLTARCLELEPTLRPPADEIVQELRRWLRQHDTISFPAAPRLRLAIITAAVAAATLAVVALTWRLGPSGDSGRRTAAPGKPPAPAAAAPPAAPVAAAPPAAPEATTGHDAAPPLASSQPALDRPTRVPGGRHRVGHGPSRRKRVTGRKKEVRSAPDKPEPINLDAPFPPR
jgi:hypothetical protein